MRAPTSERSGPFKSLRKFVLCLPVAGVVCQKIGKLARSMKKMLEKNAEFLEFHLWYMARVPIHGGGHTVDGKDPAPVYMV